jgi:ABC-type polysaccharide/polyol phosphate transport system ATPase subunit
MSPDGTITSASVWKRFRADRSRRLLRDELQRLGRAFRRKGSRGWRWALQDVNFSVDPGDSIGLIGENGSGKTTLLKILSRVMYPYAGSVDVRGRIGALIEVRAGIHPDLSGRENVYITGSLLGLRRREVAKRFDDIVSFAELESSIDRQVKFYSTGMQMRLGFAVAAFLEPDVLLVDEALAVGDAAFQQRCLERMREVLANGTTLMFVSHDFAAVEATCSRGLWLREGRVAADGAIRDVLGSYRNWIEQDAALHAPTSGLVRLVKTEVSGPDDTLHTLGPIEVRLLVESDEARSGNIYIGISEGPAAPIFVLRRDVQLGEGMTDVRCAISQLPLPRGRFFLWVGIIDAAWHDLLRWHPAVPIDVAGPELDQAPPGIMRLAPVHVDSFWTVVG